MRTTFIHLTQEERYHIHIEDKKKVSAGQIAKDLDRDKSTITRELQRNTGRLKRLKKSSVSHETIYRVRK